MYVCVSGGWHVHVKTSLLKGSEESDRFPEAGEEVVMNCPLWVLGTKPESSGRDMHTYS